MDRRIAPYLAKLSRYEWLNKGMTAGVSVVLPAVLGYLFKYWQELADTDPSKSKMGIVFFALLGLQIVLAILSLMVPSTAPRAVEAMVNLLEEREELLETIASADDQLSAQVAMNGILSQGLANLDLRLRENGKPERMPIKDALDLLLGTLVDQGDLVFGFSDRELYNFCVYEFNPTTGDLESLWRQHHPKLKTQGLGRPWKPDRGHVGACYSRKSTLIASDLRTGAIWDGTEDDKAQYAAAAAVPLFRGEDCVGVFVLTSNIPGRFGKEGDEDRIEEVRDLLEAVANLLTVYLTYTEEGREHGTTEANAG